MCMVNSQLPDTNRWSVSKNGNASVNWSMLSGDILKNKDDRNLVGLLNGTWAGMMGIYRGIILQSV